MNRNLLKENQLRAVKFTGERQRLWDGDGLSLRVLKSAHRWVVEYKFRGKRNSLTIGSYPRMSLREARRRRDDIKDDCRDGIDPQAPKSEDVPARTFSECTERWQAQNGTEWSDSHRKNVNHRLKNYVLPHLGDMPIGDVTSQDIKPVLDRVVAAGYRVTARKVRQYISQICRFAVIEGDIASDPAQVFEGYIKGGGRGSHPHVTDPVELGKLLRVLDTYTGSESTRIALCMAPHVMLRPGELRRGRWSEIDLKSATWVIPSSRMKKSSNGNHIVPLSRQVIAMLRDLEPITSAGELLFPGLRDYKRPISDGTLSAAMRRLDIPKDVQSVHGFRHTSSTLLNEAKGFDPDLIETQLHHADSSIRGKYNSAQYMEQRRAMMQSWSDYLDTLKTGAEIVELRA